MINLVTSLAQVAPREGAWIEIVLANERAILSNVAPREGAWIEIAPTAAPAAAPLGRAP